MYRRARLFGQIFIGVREQDHRLLGMTDDMLREIGLIVHDQRDDVLARNVAGGHDGEFVPREIACELNAADAPARDGAAHGYAMKHSRKGEVIHVLRLTSNFLSALLPRYGSADCLEHLVTQRSWRRRAACSRRRPDRYSSGRG